MSYIVDEKARLTGFGENQVAYNTPIAQVSAIYGLRDDVFTTILGSGNVIANEGLFEVSTGTSPVSIATAATDTYAIYRPGQALCARLTSIFGPPTANMTQVGGLITSDTIVAFGYDGTSFGIVLARDGLNENQTLQITTPAGGSENATITVNGTGYTVPLTSGTVEHNAFEIAVSLNTQVPNYEFSSNGGTVEALASLPLPAGSFAFTSATAVASWTQVTAGQAQVETWTPQANWNGQQLDSLDPSQLNTYEIVFDGNTQFYVQNENSEFILVHTIQWMNSETELMMRNPTQRVGWGVRNSGNTTNITMKGGNCALFLQGEKFLDKPPRGDCVTEVNTTSSTEITLLTLRNRLSFGGILNRASVILEELDVSSDTNRFVVLKAYINPEFDLTTGDLIFEYEDETNSIVEVAKDNIELISGQQPILCYVIPGGTLFSKDLTPLTLTLLGRDVITFTAQISTGSASAVNVGVNWKEDL